MYINNNGGNASWGFVPNGYPKTPNLPFPNHPGNGWGGYNGGPVTIQGGNGWGGGINGGWGDINGWGGGIAKLPNVTPHWGKLDIDWSNCAPNSYPITNCRPSPKEGWPVKC